MTGARDQALEVLRDIWAREGAELPAAHHGKTCKNMKHVGFDVDEDLRAAWREKLAREGKLGTHTVADLLAERRDAGA
jgi:hypothetical protein